MLYKSKTYGTAPRDFLNTYLNTALNLGDVAYQEIRMGKSDDFFGIRDRS